MIRYNTKRLWGYSGDTKPMTVQIGDRFLEIDSRTEYLFTEYNEWVPIGGDSGCIVHTDITWEQLNTGNNAATLKDCFYNVIDRPNSGTDPLYVLVEGGRVDLDNEVVRIKPSTGSLCIDNVAGFGCFNVYAETFTFSVTYVPGVEVIQLQIPGNCSGFSTGTTVTETFPGTATGTVIFTETDGETCFIYVEVTSGTFGDSGIITNGSVETTYNKNIICESSTPLSVGTNVIGVTSSTFITPTGTITSISGGNIIITPTSGDWNGVLIFGVEGGFKGNICFYTLTSPIVSVNEQLNSETVCWDAESFVGFGVYLNTLMQAPDGLIYGTLQNIYCPPYSFCERFGQIFSLDPNTNLTRVLYDFEGKNDGANPSCNVVEISGVLYGTCSNGGGTFYGTLWKWEISTSTFTVLHSFGENYFYPYDGTYPYGGLVNVGGILYGVCEGGGYAGTGTIFSYDPGTDTYTNLNYFNGVATYPQGTLVEVNPGELWGTSYYGGYNDNGTIFKYTIGTNAIDVVINLDYVPNFGSGSVQGASGGVHLGSDNKVYFNTNYGGASNAGTICQITNVSTTPTLNVLYEFNGTGEFSVNDAVCPIYIDGNLYGVTNNLIGPTPYPPPTQGAIYKYNIASGVLTILHDFTSTDGQTPYLGQLFALGDELFGMTNPYCPIESGCQNYGQIFKYNIVTDEYTNIHKLNAESQTSSDVASLICNSITNPDYTCISVGNCVYISGPLSWNGATLVVKTVVTYNYCYDNCEPTTGDTLYNGSDHMILIGTILTVTPNLEHPECGTMSVELADNNYSPDAPFSFSVDETSCQGTISEVQGTTIDYSVEPFTGGFMTTNLPCYYNVPYDVITEYPLSQELTKSQIDYLVNNSLLVPGTYYHIMDVDFFLYGGTEIVIQAVSPNTFADTAMGKFYNPKYNKEVEGYGVWFDITEEDGGYNSGDTAIWGGLVWTCLGVAITTAPSSYNLDYTNWSIPGRIKINLSSISGTFNVGDHVYGWDNSLMGLVTNVGTDYIIVMAPPSYFAYPTWESFHYIYDDDSGAQAIMDSFEISSSFYSDFIYNSVWDEIKYDYSNDFISYRKDNSGNSVNQERWEYDDYGTVSYRGILGMQWGNDFDDNIYVGVGSNTIFGLSYADFINWKGGPLYGNTINSSTVFLHSHPYFNIDFINNDLKTSGFYNIILNVNSSINSNTISNNSNVLGLSLSNGYSFSLNIIDNGSNLDFSNTVPLPASIRHLISNYGYISNDLSSATIIYGDYSKSLVRRQDGDTRIMYIDNSDVQQIVGIMT